MSKYNKKKFSLAIIILGVCLAGLLSGYLYSKMKRTPQDDALSSMKYQITNIPFPKTELISIGNNKSADDFRASGRVLVVYFQSTCGACEMELSLLNQHLQELPADVKIVFVSFENTEILNKFSDDNSSLLTFRDQAHELRQNLNITSFPTNLLVKDGVIIGKWAGSPKDFDTLKYHLNKLYDSSNSE